MSKFILKGLEQFWSYVNVILLHSVKRTWLAILKWKKIKIKYMHNNKVASYFGTCYRTRNKVWY